MFLTIFQSNESLHWGNFEIPWVSLGSDWFGEPPADRTAAWAMMMDRDSLWFCARGPEPSCRHPQAGLGKCVEGLWEYDVAECFLSDPASGRYLEWNVSPDGAWWGAGFEAPRRRLAGLSMPDVGAHASHDRHGGWIVGLRLPLKWLAEVIDFGPQTRANVNFIFQSPAPRYFSVAKLRGEQPDFHQPGQFLPLEIAEPPAFPV